MADLAAFVEEERGHEFEHPVHVDFLTAAEYTAERPPSEEGPSEEASGLSSTVTRDNSGPSGWRRRGGPLRSPQQRGRGGTLAFYDPADERVRVRGTEMSVGLEVTLAERPMRCRTSTSTSTG